MPRWALPPSIIISLGSRWDYAHGCGPGPAPGELGLSAAERATAVGMLRSGNATPVGIGQSLPDVSGALPGRFGFPMRLREPSPKHPSTLADGNFSLGSAAVGAALSNVPLLRSGLWLEP